MSKNYELIQQAAMNRQTTPSTDESPAPSFSKRNGHSNGNGNGRKNGHNMDLDRLASEESSKLIQRVFLRHTEESPRVVEFAGIDHGNGCSLICARAAEVLANDYPGSVCVVDANFRTPSLSQLFGVENRRGLADSLLQDGPIRDFTQQLRPANLWLLSSGSLAADSPGLLNSERVKTRLAELRKEFDHVLIDVAPLSPYGDGFALAPLTDGIVLVLEANSTYRESALKVIESLRASQIQVLGAVLNKRTYPIPKALYDRL